jgi:hypothetical protein
VLRIRSFRVRPRAVYKEAEHIRSAEKKIRCCAEVSLLSPANDAHARRA